MATLHLQDDYTILDDPASARCEDLGLEYAPRYADIGIPVYPCVPGKKLPFSREHSCSVAHKRGYNDATLDPNIIEAWWREHPNANIGAMPRLGKKCVWDFDWRHGGEALFAKLRDRHGDAIFETPTTVTFDGRHLWFDVPEGWSGTMPQLPQHSGLEILGPKGFGKSGAVLLPYSYRADQGFTYHSPSGRSLLELPCRPVPIEVFDTLSELFADMQVGHAPRRAKQRGEDNSDEVGWLAEYDRESGFIRDVLQAVGCDVPFEEGQSFSSPLRDDNRPSCTFHRDRSGMFKYHDFTYPGMYFTPAHLWAAWISGKPIDELYSMPGPSLACWKIRLLFRTDRLRPPPLQLPLLPGHAPGTAHKVWTGYRLLLQCRMAYNKTDKPAPAPLSYRFLEKWVPMPFASAQVGLTWLLQNGVLVCVGRESGCNLYWPASWR